MRKELQILLIFSIAICLYSMVQMSVMPSVSINPHLVSGIASWKAPVLRNAPEASLAAGQNLDNPFSTRFFEKAELKGFMRDKNNKWQAIFAGPDFQTEVLEIGQPNKGLTLLSANGKYCRVRFGSIIREFRL